jgi:hypothetical protein
VANDSENLKPGKQRSARCFEVAGRMILLQYVGNHIGVAPKQQSVGEVALEEGMVHHDEVGFCHAVPQIKKQVANSCKSV